MSKYHSKPTRFHADTVRSSRRLALAAIASVCAGFLLVPSALAQEAKPTRPMIPFAGEPIGNRGFSSVRLSPAEAAALLRGYEQRERLPAYKPQFAGGTAQAPSSGAAARVVSPAIINSNRAWVATGPVNLEPPFQDFFGPFAMAGRVNQVLWDPVRRDAAGRPNVLLIATASGGLWRATIDYDVVASGGQQPAKRGTDTVTTTGVQPLSDYNFPTLSTSSVAVHPTNTRIIYVGTGDFDTGLSGQTGVGVGIMKTVNDGRNWIKIGDVDASGAPIMQGTCVSAIQIDPNNPRRLVATSGRGATAGFVWLSEDEGNTWRKPNFTDASGTRIDPPAGDWSGVDYSAARNNQARSRTWYATCINNGVYRSDDAGLNWRKLSVPLRFNTQGAGGLALEVAASKLTTGADILYVMDASQNVRDGRILKSTDRGVTWVETQGNYPEQNNGNWGAAYYASHLYTGTIPVNVLDANSLPVGTSSFPQEVLFGGSRLLSASAGVGVKTSATSIIYGGGQDVGAGPEWTNLSQDIYNHYDVHSVAQRPSSIAGGEAYFTVSDGGGVYGYRYLAGSVDPLSFMSGFGWLPETQVDPFLGRGVLDINSNLTVQQLIGGNFLYALSGPFFGETRFVGGSDFLGTPTMSTFLDDTTTNIDWSTVPGTPFATVSRGQFLDDVNLSPIPPAITTPTTIPSGTYFGAYPVYLVQNATFDVTDLSGQTQYVWVNNQTGSTGWPAISLYYTNDNWDTALDISPDRYRLTPFGSKLTTPTLQQVYVFNRTDPQDTGTATTWIGSRKPDQGNVATMATVPNFNAPNGAGSLLAGTDSLWRYDPPGTRRPYDTMVPVGGLPGTNAAFSYPNKDHGVWRRVGNAAITSTGYITSIAALSLSQIYVGTSSGEIYFSLNANNQDTTLPLTNLNGNWIKLNTPAEFVGHPITSIEYNPQPNNGNIDFRDIVVTLGGAASTNPATPLARVWRNTNATLVTPEGSPTGTSISRFTPASGQGAVQLPDVSANSISRDPDDGFNTWFVATDVGVFATDSAGSTWSNATAPLGLPNVKTNRVQIVQGFGDKWLMAATSGRGVWRFNIAGLVAQVTDPAITTNFTISRINGQLVTTVLVTNNGGAAYDVKITPDATAIVANGTSVVSSSFPVVNGVPQPISLGTIGKGQTQSITLRYSGAAPLRPGTLANYRIGGTFVKPPLPPGTSGSFNNGTTGKSLRLP